METGTAPISFRSDELSKLQHDANIYSIVRTVEQLEKLFVSGSISADEYDRECTILIAQFSTAQNAMKATPQHIREFLQKYGLHCPLAEDRLLEARVPATKLYALNHKSENHSFLAFELSGHFITLLDAIKLGQRAVDVVLPLVQEVLSGLRQVNGLPTSLNGVSNLKKWTKKLYGMAASDELSDADCRQLSLDVDTAYSGFRRWLQSNKQN